MTKLIKYLNLIILLLATSTAYAETTNCTAITSIPYTIGSPGIYCLTGNLSMGRIHGRAIFIGVDDVVLDLNGFTLEGTGGLATQTVGIKAYQRKNITIRNGTVRGFSYGILLDDVAPPTTSQGHLIEDIHADKNTHMGISISGNDSTVRRNRVVGVGGNLLGLNSYGISLYGDGGRALNNDISSTVATAPGGAIGLFIHKANDAVVEGNRIDDVSTDVGLTIGIVISQSSDVLARGNSITSATRGIDYASSTGKYRDNLTSNVSLPFLGGGIDAGGNN